jgi:hypothetical protein
MFPYYGDIIKPQKLNGQKDPKWFTEHGYPRYCKFHPSESSNIYADEIVLLEIACQCCKKVFCVEMNDSAMKRLNYLGGENVETLANSIVNKTIHYGDPPNIQCCSSGPTMNCINLRVLEYWKREKLEWNRNRSLEIEIEDMVD